MDEPITEAELKILISVSGFAVDLVIQPVDGEGERGWALYAAYNSGKVVRKLYAVTQEPRHYLSASKAIQWGVKMGFRSISLYAEKDSYGKIPGGK